MSEGMLGLLPLPEVQGPMSDLQDKLAGKNGPMWLSAFKWFLRKENPWPKFPTWRTVKLGTHKTVEEFITAIEAGGSQLSKWARDIITKVTLAKEPTELDLVVITGSDVGLEGRYTTAQVNAAAEAHGLLKCPAEVGPALREQYPEQPKGEGLHVAMEPVADSDDNFSVFLVAHSDDDRWLSARSGRPDRVWRSGCRWIFARGKPVKV